MILLVMTDGRDELIERTLPCAADQVPYDRLVIHDDTGSHAHREALERTFRVFGAEVIGAQHRLGFGGAIANAWRHLRTIDDDYVVHLEDDFMLDRPVDWHAVRNVLATHPHVVQMALRRQPWNDDERAAGGIVEQHSDDYAEVTWGDLTWLEHRRFFTTNPSMYRLSLCQRGWPDGRSSEGRFGIALCGEDPAARFAYWGARDSGEWCTHIGTERVGIGY